MKNNNRFPWRQIWLSVIVQIVCTAALVCLGGLLVWKETVPLETAKILVPIMATAVMYGLCWYTAKRAGKRKMQLALCVAAVCQGVYLLVGAMAFGGLQFFFDYRMLLPVAAAVLAALTATTPKAYRR